MRTIPLKHLRLAAGDFENPRDQSGLDHRAVRELAANIARNGLLEPLLVTPDGLIMGGQRRYEAIKMLVTSPDRVTPDDPEIAHARAEEMRQGVPVVIRPVANDLEAEVLAIAHNAHENLSSFELATAMARLNTAMTQSDIAAKLGRSKADVSRRLKAFNSAGCELMGAWRRGEIPFDQVYELSKLPHVAQGERVDRHRRQMREGGRSARGRARGPRGRPSIDRVRYLAGHATAKNDVGTGALRALRWMMGELAEDELELEVPK